MKYLIALIILFAANLNAADLSYSVVLQPPSGVASVVSTNRGDTSPTLTSGVDSTVQIFSSNLTANRTITLATAGAKNGDEFTIVRSGLGLFTLDVGGLKTIASATASSVTVVYDGSAWRLKHVSLL